MNKLPFAGFSSTNLYFEPKLAIIAPDLENAFYPGSWKPRVGLRENVITSIFSEVPQHTSTANCLIQ